MIAPKPYIIYSLPQSRVTQALSGKKIEKAWDKVKLFLAEATTAYFALPKSISITAYTADEDHGELPFLATETLKRVEYVFGEGSTSPVAYHWPENIPTKQTKTIWDLTYDDLDKAINFMIDGQPWPKYNLGPVELILSYDFKLIDPISKIELPRQQFTSTILIWLSRNNSISASLCFPFEQPDSEFWSYVNKIEYLLPFKFDRKFLRLGRSNKKGTANVFSKI